MNANPASDALDPLRYRADFPLLARKVHGKPLIWFDNAATTQKPQSVIDAISNFYTNDNSNIHRGAHTLAARSTDAFPAGPKSKSELPHKSETWPRVASSKAQKPSCPSVAL